MLKIEFPAENKALAAAIGKALTEYAGGARVVAMSPAHAAPYDTSPEHPAEPGEPTTLPCHDAPYATAPAADDEPQADAPADGRKDQKGVVFNAQFCGNAKDPFYTSGARLGQWKKARGVDETAYDDWYAGEFAKAKADRLARLADLGIQTGAPSEEPAPNPQTAAAAFGNQQQQPSTTMQAVGPAFSNPPSAADSGALMAWIAEQQNAGKLTQDDVTAAWQQTGLQIQVLFDPTHGPAHARTVYQVLATKVRA